MNHLVQRPKHPASGRKPPTSAAPHDQITQRPENTGSALTPIHEKVRFRGEKHPEYTHGGKKPADQTRNRTPVHEKVKLWKGNRTRGVREKNPESPRKRREKRRETPSYTNRARQTACRMSIHSRLCEMYVYGTHSITATIPDTRPAPPFRADPRTPAPAVSGLGIGLGIRPRTPETSILCGVHHMP